MTSMRNFTPLIFLLALNSIIVCQLNTDIWERYVLNPSPKNYNSIVNQIDRQFPHQKHINDNGDILNPFWTTLYEERIFKRLLELFEKGDSLTFDIMFRLYPYYGSGEPLETFNITIGNALKNDPELFFLLYTKYFPNDMNKEFPKRRLDFFICALDISSEYWQTFDGQIHEIEERIRIFNTMPNSNYLDLRELCIKILEEDKNGIIDLLAKHPDAEP